MSLDKAKLLGFLGLLDRELARKVRLVAAGGTAMTLLDLKPSTIDIDFTLPGDDLRELDRALQAVPHGFKIDRWPDGMVFSQMLPADYIERSLPVRARFRNIILSALHPVDIIVTKIGRLDERDEQDIAACIGHFGVTWEAIEQRARQVIYVGREENYQINLAAVLRKFFPTGTA